MRTSDIFGPIEDWAKEHDERNSNCLVDKYAGIDRRRVAQIKKAPHVMTLGELESMGRAFGFRVVIVRDGK